MENTDILDGKAVDVLMADRVAKRQKRIARAAEEGEMADNVDALLAEVREALEEEGLPVGRLALSRERTRDGQEVAVNYGGHELITVHQDARGHACVVPLSSLARMEPGPATAVAHELVDRLLQEYCGCRYDGSVLFALIEEVFDGIDEEGRKEYAALYRRIDPSDDAVATVFEGPGRNRDLLRGGGPCR